jgi:selenocysteine lyase/cysteine desulfurase
MTASPAEYDIARVRSHFPALREGAAHFDGPGGTQTPDVVAHAVAETLTSAIANRGFVTAAERRGRRRPAGDRCGGRDLRAQRHADHL